MPTIKRQMIGKNRCERWGLTILDFCYVICEVDRDKYYILLTPILLNLRDAHALTTTSDLAESVFLSKVFKFSRPSI
jgi:hypothetical protein